MEPKANLVCPLCGQGNQCMTESTDVSDCWCFGVSVSKESLERVPADLIDKACLCPGCAAADSDRGEQESPSVGPD